MKLDDVSQIIYRALDVMNSQNVRKFSVPPRTYMGPGSLTCCGEAMKSEGFARTFIMVDAF
ncbi:MAG: ethanolamine utilization protein EutG, partial [Wohlfahrtiimonas sp.]